MMRIYVHCGCIALLLAIFVAFGACTNDPVAPTSVTFMAGFRPQANLPFVAAYVAKEKGYFQDQGLDVDIQHSTGEHVQLLLSGDVDFTTADASYVLKSRADPGIPIKAIALFGQQGQQAFVALKESGINTPKQWEGKTFGYKISVPPEYLAILKANSVDRSKIKEVRVGFDVRVLTENKVDVLAVFKSNEPDTLRRLGFETEVFDPADYGVPTLGLTYIARNVLVEGSPDTIKRFLKATMRGLEFAFNNTEEALDIVLKYAENGNREHMRFMLLTEKENAISSATDQNGLGWMTEGQWDSFQDMLVSYGALARPVDLRSTFTDQFLKQIYTNGNLNWP